MNSMHDFDALFFFCRCLIKGNSYPKVTCRWTNRKGLLVPRLSTGVEKEYESSEKDQDGLCEYGWKGHGKGKDDSRVAKS